MRSMRAGGFVAFWVICLLAASPAAAQMAGVSGQVIDAETGAPLALANVVVAGTPLGTSTDDGGRYRLRGVPPGEVELVATFVGYETARRGLTLRAGEEAEVSFSLQPREIVGGEVLVEGVVPLAEERQIGLERIPIQLIRRIPTAIEDDLFRSLQLLPGVKPASDFSSRLYIRGGTPDQTLILLDRAPVYNPTHFFGFFSTFNIDALEDVRLWKGTYPVHFGGRLGSVVDVATREGARDRIGGGASLGLLASRAHLTGPLSAGATEGAFFVSLRRSTVEPLLAILRETEEFVPDGFYFYDLNARADLDLAPGSRLSVTAYGGLDDVRFPFADEARVDLRYGNRTGSVTYTQRVSDRVATRLRAGVSHYRNFPSADISGTRFDRENLLTDLQVDGDVAWISGEDLTLRGGAHAGSLSLSLEDVFDGRTVFTNRTSSAYGRAFAEAAWTPGPWIITPGLRVEYFHDGGFVRLGPRLAVERYLGERALLQAAYGRYHQFLSLISNEAFSGFDVWVATAEGVPPAFGDQFTLGVKTRPTDQYGLDVEVYYRTLRQLFELDPRLQDPSGRDYAELFRFGDGYAAGAELLFERRQGALTGFLAYTFGVTQRRFAGADGAPFNPHPETGEPQLYSPKHDRRHDLALVANLDIGQGWGFTGAFVYLTGQAYTRVAGHYEVVTLPGTDPVAIVTTGYNRARLPPYHRLDVGVTRTGRLFGIGEYELRLQAINVYSRRNLWFYWLDQRENPVALQPARQLPILPNISLTVEF